jgi:glycosyltransferase involved in cell wall biosynthesis
VIVDVILPCLNEASALPWMLDRMPDGFRPIVVDNGSTDGSPDVAKSLGATVVSEPGLRCGRPRRAAGGDQRPGVLLRL